MRPCIVGVCARAYVHVSKRSCVRVRVSMCALEPLYKCLHLACFSKFRAVCQWILLKHIRPFRHTLEHTGILFLSRPLSVTSSKAVIRSDKTLLDVFKYV